MFTAVRYTLAFATIASVALGSAAAETLSEDLQPCPTGAVSVYFAPGANLPSDETIDLINRVGEVASGCDADGVDIVAWVDPAEAEGAMALALDRLKLVAAHLGESGLAADRMRVGARVQAGPARIGPAARNVRIIIRDRNAVQRTDTPPPTRVPETVTSPEAI